MTFLCAILVILIFLPDVLFTVVIRLYGIVTPASSQGGRIL